MRLRWWGGLALWVASLIVAAVLAYAYGKSATPRTSVSGKTVEALRTDNARLKQQLAIAQRSLQVANVASRKLTDTLAERDEQINGLRADLSLYARLAGGSSRQDGLQLQGVYLHRVARSRAWNITLTLTRNARRRDIVHGRATVDIDGVRAGSLARLHWSDIAAPEQKEGMPFKFKYFQQLHGTLMLPADFTPNRLRIHLDPRGSKNITQSMSWNSALKNPENPQNVE